MNANTSSEWQRSSPLSAVFFIGRIIQAIVKNAVQAAAPLAAFAFTADGPIGGNLIVGASLAAVGVVVAGVLRYLFFRFRIDEKSVVIRDGVFKKTQLDVEFDRIQAVNTEQNILYRPFELVNVMLDTAGSSGQEGVLPGVPTDLARDLEQRVATRSAARRAERSQNPNIEDEHAAPEERRSLLRYEWSDLILVGLTSNRALVFLAVLAPFSERVFEALGARIVDEAVPEAVVETLGSGLLLLAAGVLLIVVVIAGLLALISILGAIFRYYGYELNVGERRLRATGGLLTRHEHSIRHAKIQTLVAKESPIQRMFGVLQFNARQAASGAESSKKSFLVPLLRSADLSALTRESVGDEYPDLDLEPRSGEFERVHPYFIRASILRHGLLPATVVTIAMIILPGFSNAALLLPFAWLPVSALIAWRRYRCLGVRIGSTGLTLRTGLLGYRTIAHLYRKVQRVTVSQSPFQRRRGLATLRLHLAGGAVRIPFVPRENAESLADYILYCAESDQRAWL